MQVTKEQLIDFAKSNFYVINLLSQIYYPLSKCYLVSRQKDWHKYSIKLIFSKNRNMRLSYSRYLLMYAMIQSGYTLTYIGSLFGLSYKTAQLGRKVITNYLELYATSDEIYLIKELVSDFREKYYLKEIVTYERIGR